jgi:S1-C subfamily serine protease
MLRAKLVVMAALMSLLAVQSSETHANEIQGQVVEKTGNTVRIATSSTEKPRVGDNAEIFVILPDLNGIAVVATGRVEEVRHENIMVKIERATGTVKRSQFARIISVNTVRHPPESRKSPEISTADLAPELPELPLPTAPPTDPRPTDPGPAELGPANDSGDSGFANVARHYGQALFLVGEPGQGSGTAFVISRKHRLLATNAHVADLATQATMNESRVTYKVVRKWYHPGLLRKMDDGKTLVRSTNPNDGGVAFMDSPDLAILQLESLGPDLPAEVKLASPSEVLDILGHEIGMLGYPGYHNDQNISKRDLFASATFGTGTINRLTGFSHDSNVGPVDRQQVQFSAPNFPGFSGAPLFLRNGRVVAVNNHLHIRSGQQQSFGVRIDSLWELLQYEGLAKFVVGSPNKTVHTSRYRPQSDHQVEDMRAAMRLVHDAANMSRRGDFRHAHELLEQAIENAPNYWKPYWKRALVANHQERHGHLSTSEKIALRRSALNDHLHAASLYQEGHGKPNVRVQLDVAREYINLGRQTGQHANFDEALAILTNKTVLANIGANLNYLLALRGSLRIDLDDLSGALDDLNHAIQISPDKSDFYRTRARIWHRLGQPAAAGRDEQLSAKLHQQWMASHDHHKGNHH